MGILTQDLIKNRIAVDGSGCWLWQKYISPYGYGQLRVSGTAYQAHRASYEVFVGGIPAGKVIDHLCRVRHCVNPTHLDLTTQRENLLRGNTITAVNAAKTHCKNGHPLSGDNMSMKKTGRRCKKCHAAEMRSYKARKS